ncbi:MULTISPECIES: ArsA family ATPase [unclassified Rhodococcus (in: high G+C Gram-positive bacteria)]|uniref:ArsA family ATPase n=1 Tax=unclassified Rhodococcus (in: high G+C Gram-positive bacteria) TaxID=192944 RepID=UPI000DF459E8|nr:MULTISPECIES: ArsA-related P-loop ATPase [unclassified Rhodococcus (in: high G+C Gram-positive bacteria)]RRQ27739.1 ArsA family ATPase [Rhodococcus sp. Eu-32]
MFVGKGGAGKTTIAAKAALDAARAGSRSLVVSFDQAHSTSDVVDLPSSGGARGRIVSVADRLDVLELDTLALVESSYRSLAALLSVARTGHEHGVRFGAIDPEEVVGAPGVQEMLGLHRIVELVDENAWDTVFVDLPSTADALRTLQLPSLVTGYVERLWPQHDRIVAGTGADPRLTIVVAFLERVVANADAVHELLFDRERTSATVVATPERVGIAEARRTMSAAVLMGLNVDTVVVNKVLPQLNSPSVGLVGAHPAVFWFEGWRSAQQAVLHDFAHLAAGATLVVVERSVQEPVGLASLDALTAEHRTANARPDERRGTPAVARESGSGLESVYTMTMHLPVVDTSSLTLGRVEDDVIIGADGVRTRVRLASVLRRCVVVGAEFDDENLVIRFAPDPNVWPV